MSNLTKPADPAPVPIKALPDYQTIGLILIGIVCGVFGLAVGIAIGFIVGRALPQ